MSLMFAYTGVGMIRVTSTHLRGAARTGTSGSIGSTPRTPTDKVSMSWKHGRVTVKHGAGYRQNWGTCTLTGSETSTFVS
jgi:hypothetical protein